MTFENKGSEFLIKPYYELKLDTETLSLNSLLGKTIEISFVDRISCSNCGRDTKKSYGQGFCYPCFISVPQAEECVFHPELCRAHEGVARDMEYAKENCLVDQYVYLALSGGLKVGVTRYHQIPTRWVDQGAVNAIKIAIASNRYLAGLIEVELKKIFADKTNWRKMLMGNDAYLNLFEKKQRAIAVLNKNNFQFHESNDKEYSIEYPINSFPKKVTSLSFDTTKNIKGLLTGVKGQYLLFEDGGVLNIRKHTGYHIYFEVL
jgi:hypothetical protein